MGALCPFVTSLRILEPPQQLIRTVPGAAFPARPGRPAASWSGAFPPSLVQAQQKSSTQQA